MKITVLLLLLITTISPAFSSTGIPGATLEISAYKYNKELENQQVKMEITDAISESLDIKNDGDDINLTPALESLLGKVSAGKQSTFGQHVAFSYRIYGNKQGSYTLNIQFGDSNNRPFTRLQGDVDSNYVESPQPEDMVSLSFSAHYLSYDIEFTDSSIKKPTVTTEVDKQTVEQTIGKRKYSLTGYKDDFSTAYNETTGAIIASNPSGTDNAFDIDFSFTISDTSNTPIQEESFDGIWITKGVIGITIDNTEYEKAKAGIYKIPVTITLTEK